MISITTIKGVSPIKKVLIAMLLFAIGCPLYHMSTFVGNLTKLTGVLYFLYVLIVSPKYYKGFVRNNVAYVLLCFWILLTTIRMFFVSEQNAFWGGGFSETTRTLFLGAEFIPNLIPLTLLLYRNDKIVDLYSYNQLSKLLLIIFLIFTPYAIHHMIHYEWSGVLYSLGTEEWGDEGTYGDFVMNSSLSLSALAPPIVMIYLRKYESKRIWFFYLLTTIVLLFISAFTARRSGTALYFFYYVVCYYFYFRDSKKNKYLYIIFLMIVFCALYKYILVSNNTYFSLLLERGIEDTRSGVENSFYKDMDVFSWLFGRTWFGAYYEPAWGRFRTSIETGFLAFILRGGIVYLLLYLMVLVPTAYKGLLKSKNVLVKSFAIMIFMHVIELYPYGWPSFTIQYYTVWLGVFICQSSFYRNMSDDDIYERFNFIKLYGDK